jgi:2-oxoglutarate ferredoxin oxidoreductase subunit alpha
LVCLDDASEKIHKKYLKKDSMILKGTKHNMYFSGSLFKIFSLEFEILSEALKNLKNFGENLREARNGFLDEKKKIELEKPKHSNINKFMNGTQGIANGAINSGLDLYFAYPMTPASPLLGELAEKQIEKNFLVFEPENEISAIMTALGSSITGAKVMIGTAGGGFDLMTEAFSMSGVAEIPLVVYLATRPGPGTGVPTYTSQQDLNLARHCGHGEFFRLVSMPGDPVECQELINQAFYFSQKYKIPCIVLSDKHLGESFYTFHEEPKMIRSEKSTHLKKYSSYEHDADGFTTENPEIINQNFERRLEKEKEIKKEVERLEWFKVYGKKDSRNILISWGSTKGAILDSIKGLDVKFIQILYAEPFSQRLGKEIEKAKKIVLVENSSTGTMADLIAEKLLLRIDDKNKILRYDGRPFLSDELKKEIEKRLR